MEKRSTRITVVAMLVIALLSGFTAQASARSVKITGGNGSHAHPYTFKVQKNRKNVVVQTLTRTYRVGAHDSFVMTERLLMSNKTTEHFSGDHSVTTMRVQYLYGCHGASLDTPKNCQRLVFGTESRFGNATKLGSVVNCTARGSNACHTVGWRTLTILNWTVDGGFHSSDWVFPKWQAYAFNLAVKIDGHWRKRSGAAFSSWFKPVLNT